jgi:hypothetical protein
MALEFRTRDERYKGPRVWPNGAAIPQARVFVDHLPPGFATDPYDPYLINDSYSHRPRYVIDTSIIIGPHTLIVLVLHPRAQSAADEEPTQLVATNSIKADGLDLLLVHHGHEYQGTLYSIPDLTVEASHQHLPKHPHRRP